ncbi:MAG: dihydropteroate synthase [Desulfobacteraceae bacterium]|nr:MAG: dihydropteroate synthase [Desulfobacteraceae bacterium]
MIDPEYLLNWGNFSMSLGRRTRIMGILNVTPDSFSDGGRFFRLDEALKRAEKMIADGADILDIGGESTRPSAAPVEPEEECRRVIPVIEHLAKHITIPISIDTTKSTVARRAVAAGASIINDISALRFDPEMGPFAAKNNVLVVLMHMKGTPADMQKSPTYDDPVGEISDFLSQAIGRAEGYGISRSNIIIDPGIGFGKTAYHNLFLMNHLSEFGKMGVPVLLGSSRKAFIRKILSPPGCDGLNPDHPMVAVGTQATVAAGILNGAHIVRVHDVAETYATVKIVDAIRNAAHVQEQCQGDA